MDFKVGDRIVVLQKPSISPELFGLEGKVEQDYDNYAAVSLQKYYSKGYAAMMGGQVNMKAILLKFALAKIYSDDCEDEGNRQGSEERGTRTVEGLIIKKKAEKPQITTCAACRTASTDWKCRDRLERLAQETNRPISYVLNKLVEYALLHCTVEDM